MKALHTLHVSTLNFPNKIENLQSINIAKLTQIDPITCVKYYDHKNVILFSQTYHKRSFSSWVYFLIFFCH
jgi:hypothetical protein